MGTSKKMAVGVSNLRSTLGFRLGRSFQTTQPNFWRAAQHLLRGPSANPMSI